MKEAIREFVRCIRVVIGICLVGVWFMASVVAVFCDAGVEALKKANRRGD